ncbi:unnamed protein product [Rotaria sordida]|uniref:RING-type domain-containing protein n=2 Tax=Rotaria sordida TaxID=392033 RepID=A0A814FYD8_9BILA|nr:unnamed protein product [Rotaria sordida]CAF0962356.1 unnamed protein product [Rotaria sordida]CAF0988919.1 unnamed protein product [Rotaria sordida]CAF1353188.1 unnamed protein product [Rotaria sordida]
MQEKLMGKVAIDSALINCLFKCPLCHGLIRSPTVINECLHRFCKLCITNYFENKNNNKCPTCQITIVNPLETLKSDLIIQRLLYKTFPYIFQREIACKPSLLSSTITNESTRIYIDSTIDVYLEYWDISLDLFPNSNKSSSSSSIILSPCYLECKANTPLLLIEKFLRIKYSLSSELKIDLFHKTFLLNTNNEKLIDICYCFDCMNKNQTLDIRFLVSPYGYKAILNHIHQLRHPVPPTIETVEQTSLQIDLPQQENPTISSSSSSSSSLSNSSSIDPKLKVKIRRSQTSTNDWYIPQSKTPNEPVELPDLVNSCETITKITKRKRPILNNSTISSSSTTTKKKSCATSTFFSVGHTSQPKRTSLIKPRTKPRRRTRFIPTMVKAPPSIFDRISMDQYDYSDQDSDNSPICSTNEHLERSVTTLRPSEMVIVNVEGNVTDSTDIKRTQKTICKVPPYIPESSSIINSPPEKSLSIIKPTPIYPTFLPTRRTLLPKKIPTMIPTVPNRIPSPDLNNITPLDLSLK